MKKIFATIFLLSTVFPLVTFAQTTNPADNPQNFQAPTNNSSGGVTQPSNSFQVVPCSGVNTGADPLGSNTQVTGCTFNSLITMVQRIINILLYVAVFIAIIMILYAGFLYLTAGGSTEKTKKAHKVIMATFVGMLIAFCSWIVVYTVVTYFIDPTFGGGNIILLQKQ